MNITLKRFIFILGIILISSPSIPAYTAEADTVFLTGQVGASSKWGSGWLDLSSPMDFAKGEMLQLKIGGTAQKVVVRLLPKGRSPDSTDGIIGDVLAVPKDRIVSIQLTSAHKSTAQISVHGGSNPWGMYSLGESNGPATLESAKLVRK